MSDYKLHLSDKNVNTIRKIHSDLVEAAAGLKMIYMHAELSGIEILPTPMIRGVHHDAQKLADMIRTKMLMPAIEGQQARGGVA